MNKNILYAGFKAKDNVEYVLRDSQGNIKPMFQEGALGKILLKAGVVSPLWINSVIAPVLMPFMGTFSTKKVIGNLITNVGFALAAGRLNGSGSPAAPLYVTVGVGTNAASVSDTTLQTEITDSGMARASGTASLVTTTQTNDTAQVTYTFTVSGTKAVTESGLLNAASTGTLLCRQVFSAINVASGDTLAVTWKVKMS